MFARAHVRLPQSGVLAMLGRPLTVSETCSVKAVVLAVDEVARYSRLHPVTVQRWVRAGTLSAVARRTYRIKRVESGSLVGCKQSGCAHPVKASDLELGVLGTNLCATDCRPADYRLWTDQVTRLEDLTINTAIRGVVPDALVTVVATKWFGSGTLELTYKEPASKLASEILFRDREPTVEVVTVGRPWSFDGDGAQFRLVPEARRIRLAHLFDPVLAVHTSLVDPLPHQITAVYDASSGQYSGCRPARSVPEPSGDKPEWPPHATCARFGINELFHQECREHLCSRFGGAHNDGISVC